MKVWMVALFLVALAGIPSRALASDTTYESMKESLKALVEDAKAKLETVNERIAESGATEALQRQRNALQENLTKARSELKELQGLTAEKWAQIRNDLEKSYHQMKRDIEVAFRDSQK